MNAGEQNSINAKKEALNRQTEEYKQAIGEEMHILKENAGRASKRALLIGAGVVLSYLLIRSVFRGNGRRLKSYPTPAPIRNLPPHASYYAETVPAVRHEPALFSLIKQQIALFLIGLITKKIQEALNNSRKSEAEPVIEDETRDIEPIYIQ